MSAPPRHFAIDADDVPRAKRFYERVFGWIFTRWGPPDFYYTRIRAGGHVGSLQPRRTVSGRAIPGMAVGFAVDDLRLATAAIEWNGGEVLLWSLRVEGPGELAVFRDTEGNVGGVILYDDRWRRPVAP